MPTRIRLRSLPAPTALAGAATDGDRPEPPATTRTEEAAALLFVSHTALARGRCR